jgi:hypothetical protein
MPDVQTLEDKPPYLSLTTLQNFLDRWGEGAIPPRIDRSALESYSGGTRSMLMSTLRQVGWVDSKDYVLPALRDAITDVDARKAHLEKWARHYYAEQLALAEQGATAGMLHESFAEHGYSGSTLRKAIVFYLALVEYLGLPTSPHFRAPKQSATPSSRKRGPRAQVPRALLPDEPAHPRLSPAAPKGETTIVEISDLATITVTVDAQWMRLPIETITTMREAIAKLEGLSQAQRTSGADER